MRGRSTLDIPRGPLLGHSERDLFDVPDIEWLGRPPERPGVQHALTRPSRPARRA